MTSPQNKNEIDGSPQSPLVLVVLLNWNSFDETRSALESVMRMTYPNFRVLLVDNGSQDGSNVELRRLTGDRVALLESLINTGYTGGCNLGFGHALEIGADYVWLLNNDAVTGVDTLSSLVALAESDERIGLVTPRIAALDKDERLTFAGGVISLKHKLYEETNDPRVAAAWDEKYPNAGLVIGTAMLVRTELVRRIGVLDPGFFAYFEDVDYSARSSSAGYRNVVDSNSVVRHFEKNRNARPHEIRPHYWYYIARNESRFWRKHLGPSGSLKLMWYSFNGFLRHRNRLKTRPESQDAILAGLWHGWLDRGGEYDPDFRMPALLAAAVKIYSKRGVLQPLDEVGAKNEALSRA
jgi:GT2 family glycosyltransferase